jgi:pSer/pThr/pTyr-binding forkhead associated (FHA) protein
LEPGGLKLLTTQSQDPWTWLLGKTPDENWRMSGTRGNPGANPKVLLLRRAIPHPKQIFAQIIDSLKLSDNAEQLRWICHRSSRGERRYWLLFHLAQAQKTAQIQYLFGLEFVGRSEMVLWFFSGFTEPNHLSPAFLDFYEDDKSNRLPRFILDGSKNLPLDVWIPQAFTGELDFRWGFEDGEKGAGQDGQKPQSTVLDDQGSLPPSPADQTQALQPPRPKIAEKKQPKRAIDESRLVIDALSQNLDDLAEPLRPIQLILCERGAPSLIQLSETRSTLGRHPQCQVVSLNPTVSTRHAIIEMTAEGAQLFDLDSQNGTFINGHPLPPQSQTLLPDLALLRLGSLNVLCRQVERTEETPEDQWFLNDLVSSGRLSLSSMQHSMELAKKQGINAGEQLVLEGLIDAEEWVRFKLGSQAFPPDHLFWTVAWSFLVVTLATLSSWWYFVGF